MTRTSGSPLTVACSVTTPWARLTAERLVYRFGGAVRLVEPAAAFNSCEPRFAGLIHDLAPWDKGVRRQTAGFAGRRPDVPILLYVPPTSAAFAVVPVCTELPAVRLQVQDANGVGIRNLERDVQWLLGEMPYQRMIRFMDRILPTDVAVARLLCRLAIQHLVAGHRPNVREASQVLGISARTLQRHFQRERLAPPKAFLDAVTLLYVQSMAGWYGRSRASVARSISLNCNAFYRLRRRLTDRLKRDKNDITMTMQPLRAGSAMRDWSLGAGSRRSSPSDIEEYAPGIDRGHEV